MNSQLQLSYVNYNKGAYIAIEGKQNSGFFYIIQQGNVKISKEALIEGDSNNLLGPGDFIGVVSAMSGQCHIETAMALNDVVLIKVLREQYMGLIQNNPAVAMKIIKQFSQRLRLLNSTLAELTLKNTAQVGPSHMFNVAEYYLFQKQYVQAIYAYAKFLKYCPDDVNAAAAREKLQKLANYLKDVKIDFGSEQLTRTYNKNTMIFAEGEPGNELFIIQKGSVKICKIVDNNEVLLAVLKAGDIFGEMALLEDKPRFASAVAYEDMSVMAVNKANFQMMSSSQPQLIDKITSLLADRIWIIYKKLENITIQDPVGRLFNTLYIQLEKNRIPLDGSDTKNSYTFKFGWPELLSMAGLNKEKNNASFSRILNNPKLQISDNKIVINSIMEIVRQTEYYRKMDSRDKLKQGGI